MHKKQILTLVVTVVFPLLALFERPMLYAQKSKRTVDHMQGVPNGQGCRPGIPPGSVPEEKTDKDMNPEDGRGLKDYLLSSDIWEFKKEDGTKKELIVETWCLQKPGGDYSFTVRKTDTKGGENRGKTHGPVGTGNSPGAPNKACPYPQGDNRGPIFGPPNENENGRPSYVRWYSKWPANLRIQCTEFDVKAETFTQKEYVPGTEGYPPPRPHGWTQEEWDKYLGDKVIALGPASACDECCSRDQDSDGLENTFESLNGIDAYNSDSDADGFSDSLEVAVKSNPIDSLSTPEDIALPSTCSDSVDNDLDGLTDLADLGCMDSDSDRAPDSRDNCVTTPNPDQLNQDGDGFGAQCDLDDDEDGIADAIDACLGTPPGFFVDTNGCPTDPDQDGTCDFSLSGKGCTDLDNCPGAYNPDQTDLDNDGIGDVCDPLVSIFGETATSLPGVHESSVAWGDYDDDGDLDLAVGGTATGSDRLSRLYRNDGEGAVPDSTWNFVDVVASVANLSHCSLAWGDYDNDGDLDLLITGYDGNPSFTGTSKLYRNDGGSFVDVASPIAGVWDGSVAWGDYDNDGDIDILLTGYTGSVGISKIYRNDAGSFTDIFASLTGVYGSSVAWGDYDNDGDLDIVLSGRTGPSRNTKVYRNAVGSFTDIGAPLVGLSQGSVAWGDYDNDGDLDLLVTGLDGNPNFTGTSKVYRNDSGTFTDIGATLSGVWNGSGVWGDLDNDGNLDVALAGFTGVGYESKVYRNIGGTFAPVPVSLTGASNQASVAWGDYDNDGDLDLLITGSSLTGSIAKLYRNNIGIVNTPPTAPSGLISLITENTVTLHWNKAADNESATHALTYNLRVGTRPGGSEIVSPMADNSSGYRRVPQIGNTNHDTSWVLKNLPNGTYYWSVQAIDNAFAGSNFAVEQTFTVNNPTTLSFGINAGWNMVSLALTVSNSLKDSVFPDAISGAFRYDNGYTQDTILDNGVGYWLKFPFKDIISLTGYHIDSDTIDVKAKWNVIGSISEPIATLSIEPIGTSIVSQFFGYNNGYSKANFIDPGRGYWVKVSQDGQLVFLAEQKTTQQWSFSNASFSNVLADEGYVNPGGPLMNVSGSASWKPVYQNHTGVWNLNVGTLTFQVANYPAYSEITKEFKEVVVEVTYYQDPNQAPSRPVVSVDAPGTQQGAAQDNPADPNWRTHRTRWLYSPCPGAEAIQVRDPVGKPIAIDKVKIETRCYNSSSIEGTAGGNGGISLEYSLHNFQKLIISDPSRNQQVLYFGKKTQTAQVNVEYYELPPPPPKGIFDTRFVSQRMVEVYEEKLDNPQEYPITISSASYPITVEWELKEDTKEKITLTDGNSMSISLKGKESVKIEDPKVTSLILRVQSGKEIPKEFALRQSYPNPFNPSAIIEFDLPKDAKVTLKIYDLLGREVITLKDNEQYEAGTYEVQFSANEFASGVYFYRISVVGQDGILSYADVKKMVLIR
ncbi:MAG: VCBS repeat-containing protein [Ignavibacteriae bacterium]|nr:VCBS repeat-containing protein [Ignavibacteriota bacterium]